MMIDRMPILIFLLFCCHLAPAQDVVVTEAPNTTIYGRVKVDVPWQQVRVKLDISVFPTNASTAPAQKLVFEVDSNYNFRAVLQSPAKRFYLFLSCSPGISSFIDKIYTIDAGDSVNCIISAASYRFSGRGSAKLDCQDSIFRLKTMDKGLANSLVAQGRYDEYHKLIAVLNDTLMAKRIRVVEAYRQQIGNEMSDILLANCRGLRYYSIFRQMRIKAHEKSMVSSFATSSTYRDFDKLLHTELPEDILLQSPNYADAIFEKLLLDYVVLNGGREGWHSEGLAWMLGRINQGFEGSIREKLLTTLFLHLQANLGDGAYLNRAIDLVKNPMYAKILAKLSAANFRGATFYTGKLKSESGDSLTLNSFGRRVLVLDFWFTGCVPCKSLNTALKPVYDYFRGNDRLKFLSVNVDRSEATWRQSIKTGLYTHHDAVNLTAGVPDIEGMQQHSLLARYGIKSFPRMVVLVNGVVFEMSPPLPREGESLEDPGSNVAKMVALLERAIAMR